MRNTSQMPRGAGLQACIASLAPTIKPIVDTVKGQEGDLAENAARGGLNSG